MTKATVSGLLRQMERMHGFTKRSGPWQDLRETVASARPYRLGMQALSYLRRLRTVSLLLRLIGWIFAFLQTGTLVILSTAILFVLLPLLLLSLMGLLVFTLLDMGKSLKRLKSALDGKRVTVFFSLGRVARCTARELACDPKTAVMIVSPFWLSGAGTPCHRLFLNLYRDRDGILWVRRYCYLSLKRRLPETTELSLIF